MEKLGEFLGWATGALFLAAMLNYAVKRINKRWILPLPKESTFRQYYQKGMRILVKYHRYLESTPQPKKARNQSVFRHFVV